jgi:hypothetical protein
MSYIWDRTVPNYSTLSSFWRTKALATTPHSVLADMRIELRRRQVYMPQQHLDVHKLGAGPQEPKLRGYAGAYAA